MISIGVKGRKSRAPTTTIHGLSGPSELASVTHGPLNQAQKTGRYSYIDYFLNGPAGGSIKIMK